MHSCYMSLSNQLFTSLKAQGSFSCLLTHFLVLYCILPCVSDCVHAVNHAAKQISNLCLCGASWHTTAVKKKKKVCPRKTVGPARCRLSLSVPGEERKIRVRCNIFSNSAESSVVSFVPHAVSHLIKTSLVQYNQFVGAYLCQESSDAPSRCLL